MTTLARKTGGGHFAALKGAPAVVLNACSSYRNADSNNVVLDAEAIAKFAAANEQMANRALRVLALAVKHFKDDEQHSSDEALESGYTFVCPLRTYGTELINLNSCEQLQLSNAPAPRLRLKRCPG
jgi:magnesium-transporting ATPase (P-type)